jgi:hypothetical protein
LKNCSSASTPPAEAPMPTMGKLGIMTLTLQVACVFDPTPRPYPFKRLFRVPVTEERLGMPQGLPLRSEK